MLGMGGEVDRDGLQFDAEVSRQIEAVYTTPDVVEQRRVVRAALALRPGDRVLDVGVGPGLLAAEMAGEVGPNGRICGIDISDSMLAIAGPAPTSRADRDSSSSSARSRGSRTRRRASTSSSRPRSSSTSTTSRARWRRYGACSGRPGRVVLLDTDWGSVVWRSSDDERMGRVLTAFEEHLADPHLPRTLATSLAKTGFTPRICRSCRCSTRATTAHVQRRPDRHRVGLRTRSCGRDQEEARAWADDLRGLGASYFFSLNRYLFVASAL